MWTPRECEGAWGAQGGLVPAAGRGRPPTNPGAGAQAGPGVTLPEATGAEVLDRRRAQVG